MEACIKWPDSILGPSVSKPCSLWRSLTVTKIFSVASWTCYGTGFLSNNWSWRIPIILQAVPAVIVLAFVYLLPESPRWLMAHGKTEAATKILVEYHGNGNPDSAVVHLERLEIEEAINIAAESNTQRWWDYRCLFNSRPVLYRVWLLMLITVFSQFIGGSVIS